MQTSRLNSVLRQVGLRQEKKPRLSQDEQEAMAMQTFQQRISYSRTSMAAGPGYGFSAGQARAPGWDYVSWRAYGAGPRRTTYPRDTEEEYVRQARNLAPYVRAVLHSAYETRDDDIWDRMTRDKETRQQQQGLSRAGSREVLDTSRERI